ncbi:putative bifunctional diguanylate cyclase/phosphodiesterase [Noviherbaspirillum sp. ST9]|uniref:putative bifunctional diguanylate cyclase/phosphodiesterase n=1 Tax=Noviherbaspirillum sp. ST9 TaxID=3401606 RepID=UPI003B58B1AD
MKSALDSLAFLAEDSEVASLMRSFDWTTCAIGAPENWPPTLIALVNNILVSRVPMMVNWGPRLLSIYNDAYRHQFLGSKHPAAFCQPYQDIWPEIWPQLEPVIERGWAGKTTSFENALFTFERGGYKEQIWATFSHSPVFDGGVVVGAFGVGMDATASVLAERRQGFQLAFVDKLRGLTGASDITAAATQLLGEHLGATQVFYSEVDDQLENFSTSATWSALPLPALPSGGRLSDYGEEIIATLRSGTPLVIDDVRRDRRTVAYAEAYEGLNIRSLLVVPLVKSGRLIANLNVSRRDPYHWTKEDIVATQDVAERTWAAVERARAEAALVLERDRSRDILDNMDECFVLLDRDFHVVQINAGALRLEQRAASEVVGRTVWEGWPGIERTEIGRLYKHAMAERVRVKYGHTYTYPDGRTFWLEMNAFPYGDGLAIFYRDVTDTKLAEQRVLAAAQHDPLTGLPNRALVFEYASRLLAAGQRGHAHGAFLFIDLDRFKPINDLYGHEIGDRLLQEVAKRLLTCVRKEDLVGRLGGDEFIVVLHQVGNVYSSATVAQHILDALSYPFEIDTLDLSISACIGISEFPQHGTDVDTLIHAADLAMYQVKHECRGNYFTYTPELHNRANASSAIEARLKRALQRDGLVLHYQPVIDMKTGRLANVEALLRLTGDDGRIIGPDQFIPVAEAAGLISQLGEWVAVEACRQHLAWQKEGLPPINLALNVSPLQFRQRGFAQQLQSIVKDAGLNPACIQIEVTESTVMGNIDEAVNTLNHIRSSGIQIALDDFGTGYSSLSRLSNLPLDKLKVDQSFVHRLGHDNSSKAITMAIIALGRTLNLEIVGEGIESEEALAYLEEQGCNQAQGYFISRPLTSPEFASWYRERAFTTSG